MTDILAELDAAIEEADAGTDALCAEYFAEAMTGVRDAIDGAWDNYDSCRDPGCEGPGGGYSCSDTLARWRPKEDRQTTGEDSPNRWGVRGDSWFSMTVSTQMAERMNDFVRQIAEVQERIVNDWARVQTRATAFTLDVGPISPEAFRIFYGDPPERESVTLDGCRIELPAGPLPELDPPARPLAEILRHHDALGPGSPVMPKAAWRQKIAPPDPWAQALDRAVNSGRRRRIRP